MSQENVETIRGLFRGVEERDLEAYLEVGHPEGWAMERGRDPERVWRVRESCIAALERRPRIEQRLK